MKAVLWTLLVSPLIFIECKKATPVSIASVSTAAVTNVSSNSVESGGTVTNAGNLPVSHVGVCWATHAGPTIGDSVTAAIFGSPNFTVTVNTLYANTTYYLRAYAENEAGTGYGNELSFTTSPGMPSVTTSDITDNQSLQAVTGGHVLNDGGATITATGVCWSTNPEPTILDAHIINANPDTGTFVDTIPNLALTTYYVRAFATNSYGTGYGNEVSFTVSATGAVSDIDGNAYPTVLIGDQMWMTANLKVSHYQNGDTIANGLSGFDWADSTFGAYTFPNGDTANNGAYGKLYNVFAINDPRNIAPAGWHVATDSDWQVLELYEGMAPSDTGATNARGTIGGKLLQFGTSGLNLLDAGILDPSTTSYLYFGAEGYYWTSTMPISNNNWFRAFNTVGGDPGPIFRGYGNFVQSVRCVKN